MTSTTQLFGLTPSGFIPKTQQQIITELQSDMRNAFGAGINLGDQSFFGQLIGILSEREALVWQELEAVYAGNFPDGAEGTGVDAILAISGLTRLGSQPTVTNPNPATQPNGVTLYGLVLYGTAGKVVQAGSLINSNTTPSYSFTLDNNVTISGASNAVQNLVMSNTPSGGGFAIGIVDQSGNRIVSPPISWVARATQTVIYWPSSPPSTGTYQLMVDGTLTTPINVSDFSGVIAAINTAASLTASGAAVTVTGSNAAYGVTFPGYCPTIDPSPALLSMATGTPTGSYALLVGGKTTATLAANASASQVQQAIAAVGYPYAKVVSVTGGLAVSFGAYQAPTLGIGTDNTNLSLAWKALNSNSPNVANCVQSIVSSMVDSSLPSNANRPFTDVNVAQSGQVFTFSFGAATPQTGQPSTAAITIPAISIVANSLGASGNFTTLTVAVSAAGNPAQGIGTATCTQDGPIEVVANQLTIIGSPSSGWTGVNNQLDCLTGQNDEDDTDALQRRADRLAGNAISPLRSMADKVSLLPGVTSVQPFQNTSQAALQNLVFSGTPAPSSGFQLVLGLGTTGFIQADILTASSLQAAINALPAYATALVVGSLAFGFSIDFSTSAGAQAQPLAVVTNNNTGVSIATSFGRAPNSFELVVTGGLPSQIAQTIYQNMPAGVASYASPSAITTGQVVSGSSQVVVANTAGIQPGLSVFGRGIPNGASVLSLSGLTVTLNSAAIGDYASTTLIFNASTLVKDEDGNPQLIGFSRPATVLFYVSVSVITDQYRSPGTPSSGVNPQSQWNPASIPTIQQAIIDQGNAVDVGGLIIGAGSNGLVGSFNDVPGIVAFSLTFGFAPNPTNTAPIQLLPTQQPLFEQSNVVVTYT